jgi:hypothetical protein
MCKAVLETTEGFFRKCKSDRIWHCFKACLNVGGRCHTVKFIFDETLGEPFFLQLR